VCKGHRKQETTQILVAEASIPVRLFDTLSSPQRSSREHIVGVTASGTFPMMMEQPSQASIRRTCAVQLNDYNIVCQDYMVPFPSRMRNSDATVFAWTWTWAWTATDGGVFEMFMECADVNIVEGNDGGAFVESSIVYRNLLGYPNYPHWDGGVDPNLDTFYDGVSSVSIVPEMISQESFENRLQKLFGKGFDQ
jgi:hypothetical protein